MNRSVPLWLVVWLFLLQLFIFIVFTIGFSWMVKINAAGSDRFGALGRVALQVATLPTKTRSALRELKSYTTGSYVDEYIQIPRDAKQGTEGFVPVPTASGIKVPGLLMRADPEAMAPGWRLLVGGFEIDERIGNGAVLLSPSLEVARTWTFDEIPVGGVEPRPGHRTLVHGLDIHPDGSVILAMDGGVSLQKFDACGNRDWTVPGGYHHAVTLDDSRDSVWTFSELQTLARVAVSDGRVLQEITVEDIIAANPQSDILELRRLHSNDLTANTRNTTGKWLADPLHFNDVDPLPAEIADRFPMFAAGDLLISARSNNLIFVLDPETLEIKWWRVGAVQRQHDPDWLPNGEISVFNNRMSEDVSQILSLNPTSYERKVLLDGDDHDFYSRIRGKHRVHSDGSITLVSPQQGRALEVSAEGQIDFELFNTKPGSTDRAYILTDMIWLPTDYFVASALDCPAPG